MKPQPRQFNGLASWKPKGPTIIEVTLVELVILCCFSAMIGAVIYGGIRWAIR